MNFDQYQGGFSNLHRSIHLVGGCSFYIHSASNRNLRLFLLLYPVLHF
nr:MAG TPA: Geminivirus AL2 protein [Caudoviricetes sp.]